VRNPENDTPGGCAGLILGYRWAMKLFTLLLALAGLTGCTKP